MKKHFSSSYRPGFAPILVIGIIAAIVFIALAVFGPWELPGFGQLSQRQIDQAISAAEVQSPTIPPGDSDQDGFSDEVEKWIRTDTADNCADNVKDAAWPPDFNNDKVVNMTDVDLLKPYFGQRVKGDSSKRFDLNADKKINLSDVFQLRNFFDASCPFYFVKVTPEISKINVEWAPAIQTSPETVKIHGVDLTARGYTQCDLTMANDYILERYLEQGSKSFSIDGSNALITPGHKYCVLFTTQKVTSSTKSIFEIPKYNLSAVPSSREIIFNWTPSLQFDPGSLGIYWGDMTASGKTECNSQDDLPTGSFAGALTYDLKVGQSSFTWNSTTTNYSVTPDHKYCTYLFQAVPGGASVVISNFLEVTSLVDPASDLDQDGFSYNVETYIGTDPSDNCADDVNDSAWPPDFNNDKIVDDVDVAVIKDAWNRAEVRFDLNMTGLVDMSDIVLVKSYYGKSCG